ncbi:hypothetical protein [Pseudoduganella sp. OTU4001]|uniref:hypothetical protein n=1 Tax=Pseudoduganella sp. OTU4001 TaxID=3043854 RepID=UPI00313B4DF3
MDTINADYDAVWKQVIARYIVDFSSFFLGEAWEGAPMPDSLDAELAKCSRDGRVGVRRVDKLLRAVGPDGGDCLWHIEVQAARQRDFAEHMLVCHYRLHDQFRLPVRSIAILGDPSPTWRPERIQLAAGHTTFSLAFESFKLRDFEDQLAELLLTDNICAWLVVAHLLTLSTRRELGDRMLVKSSLLTGLRACGWEEQKFRDAFDLINWMMALPKALQDEVDKGGQKMAWRYMFEVAAAERGRKLGLEEGLEAGREEGREEGRLAGMRALLCAQLAQRFGQVSDAVRGRVEAGTPEDLQRWCLAVVTARSIEEVF